MKHNLLVINPGSTSTRVAVFNDETQTMYEKVDYTAEELEKYEVIMDQLDFRRESVLECLEKNGVKMEDLTAVVGRGGMLMDIETGAYEVNEKMLTSLAENPYVEHASSLGAWIAQGIAEPFGIPAYVFDSPRADVLTPLAKISGLSIMPRTSTCHVLNSHMTAKKTAQKLGKKYEDTNLIVVHLGGGISMMVHEKGRIVDILSDDEGPFSPESSGRLPARPLTRLCYSGKYTEKEMLRLLRGEGGFYSYMKTVDLREVEEKIAAGDEQAKILFDALAYQIAKGIGDLATVTKGEVDAIILTGGMAYSEALMKLVHERVAFIAPIEVMPGQYEMEALAKGALEVLRGEVKAKVME